MAARFKESPDIFEKVEQKIDELSLAPDLTKNDNIENKFFKLAKSCVERLSNEFKELSEKGKAEALFYFSSLIVNLGVFQNEINMDDMVDRYKLLLIDELWCLDKENRVFYRWLNYKVKFIYSDYRNNYLNFRFYLYTAFYKDPGCSSFPALDKHPHLFTEDFSIFVNKLREIEEYLEENKKRIY